MGGSATDRWTPDRWQRLVGRARAAGRPLHIHLVGIGGAGLSAIARVLLQQGFIVSGSDRQPGPVPAGLQAAGATVYAGHAAAQVQGADALLISSAVAADNAEVVAAQAAGVPVLKRAQFLGPWLDDRRLIAVAGTHGKTTTTGMVATILEAAGLAPGFIVGATVRNLGRNAEAGRGPLFVIEADEYDHMFLGLQPQIAVVTNVEWDHPDCYPTPASFESAFQRFAGQIRSRGTLVACTDDLGARRLADLRQARGEAVIDVGVGPQASLRADTVQPNPDGGSDSEVWWETEYLGRMRLAVPGRHNVRNALAAVAAVRAAGVEPARALPLLALYRGADRRFEVKGEVAGITVIDDYAHHPTEIRATLAAAAERYPGRSLWVLFQPHTYSRTRRLWDEFRSAFGQADRVLVTDVYAARETDTLGVSGATLAAAIDHERVTYVASLDTAITHLAAHLQAGDVLLTLGAGDGYRVGEAVLATLRAAAVPHGPVV